jgi:hypothetical protein
MPLEILKIPGMRKHLEDELPEAHRQHPAGDQRLLNDVYSAIFDD